MRLLLPIVLFLAVSPELPALTEAESIVAVMRLAEIRNYAWASTVTDDARTYDILGRTQADGYSIVKLPLVNTLRRRVTQAGGDDRAEAIFRGTTRAVLRTDAGWKTLDELPEAPAPAPADRRMSGGGGFGGPGGGFGGGGMGGKGGRRRGAGGDGRSGGENDQGPLYSNLQFGLSLPHEELAVIVGSHQEWVIADGEIRGRLTDTAARLLLVRDGQREIEPLRAAGSFTIFLRDGAVVRYAVKLEGRLRIDTRAGRREVEVHQQAETRLIDVGTTKFDLPDEARAKLGG